MYILSVDDPYDPDYKVDVTKCCHGRIAWHMFGCMAWLDITWVGQAWIITGVISVSMSL